MAKKTYKHPDATDATDATGKGHGNDDKRAFRAAKGRKGLHDIGAIGKNYFDGTTNDGRNSQKRHKRDVKGAKEC